MLRKVLKRILISIPVLVGVVLLIFIMLRIVPGYHHDGRACESGGDREDQ